jgi:Rps23 Pro-64 3,4-dihydroxylase Tpa1-like proline 4-hydroxylase
MIHIEENFFTIEECNSIIELSNEFLNLDIDKTYDLKIDNNHITTNNYSMSRFNIINNEKTNWIFNKCSDWFYSKIKIKISNLKWAALLSYKENDYIGKHIDVFVGAEKRRYNIGVILNNNFTGGEFVYYDMNGYDNVFPNSVGSIIIYDSNLLHEVKPVIDGERWSLNFMIESQHINEIKWL